MINNKKISVLLDSNIRSEFYKNTKFYQKTIKETSSFLDSLGIDLEERYFFIPTTAFYESLGIKNYIIPCIPSTEMEIALNSSLIGSKEESEKINLLMEELFFKYRHYIETDWQLSKKNLKKRILKQASFCNDSLRKLFIKNYTEKIKSTEAWRAFLDVLTLEFISEAPLKGIHPDRIVRFWLITAIKFLKDERNNSLYRALKKLWTDGKLKDIIRKAPLPKDRITETVIRTIESKITLKSQGMDMLDSENIHFVTYGRYLDSGERSKVFLLTKDPKTTFLHRVAFYKSLIEFANTITSDFGIKAAPFCEGYIAFIDEHNRSNFVDVSKIPPLFQYLEHNSYEKFCEIVETCTH